MKNIFVFMILFSIHLNAQTNEFKVYDNGLIYSENAVDKLKHIVDSLNLKFKVCEFNKTFLSCAQAKANYVSLEKVNVLEAKKDLEKNISYQDFKAKYTKAVFEENLVVVKSIYSDSRNKVNVNFSSLELGECSNKRIRSEERVGETEIKGKWVFDFQEKTKYSEVSLEAFYFIEEFQAKPIADKYARLIQYSDCMIDTTAQVFYDNAKESGVRYRDTLPTKVKTFEKYVDKSLKKPTFDYQKTFNDYDGKNKKKSQNEIKRRELAEKEFEDYEKQYEKWESLRLSRLDSLKNADSNFMPMLKEALIEAKINNSADAEFEGYVGRYISKEEELELKRNRRVIGGCSMDRSPRNHAVDIALLSAETAKWEIFLRSHLNIMNDRFDRVSDGSYAQGERNTYIKEIEVLDINVLDLILGISLRIENPSKNHYFSSISRVGRALSESQNAELVEVTLLDMIADNDLDDYNRVLMYYLFANYNHNLVDENTRKLNQARLHLAISKMPDYISSRIVLKE